MTDFKFPQKKSCFLILLLFLFGCRVTLVPDYNQELAEQVEQTAKKIDRFYLNMLETTSNENGERAYQNFAEEYVEIEVELNSLLQKNKIRPLNENSTRICEIALELWKGYKEEHKADNELSDGLIKLNRTYMSDVFYAMQVAEEAKNIINDSNN